MSQLQFTWRPIITLRFFQIGNINLSTLHEELKKAGTNWGEAGAELDRLRRDLDDAKDKEAQLKHEVEAMSIREGILTAITLVAVKRDRLVSIFTNCIFNCER